MAAGLDPAISCPDSEDLVDIVRTGRTRRSHAVCVYRNSGLSNEGAFWDPPMRSTMVRDERFKLIGYSSGGETERELFDLENDPDERHNLAGDPAWQAAELGLMAALAGFNQAEAGQRTPRRPPSIPGAAQKLANRLK